MNALAAGRLNRRISLQRLISAQDSYGGPVESWVDIATVWASIEPLSGRELETAQRMASEVTHQVLLRHQPIFNDTREVAAMRVLYGKRIFNIHAALNPDEQNAVTMLLASEGMNHG